MTEASTDPRKPWHGVLVATALPFSGPDLEVDLDAYGEHVRWLVEQGCDGVTPNGSLGEYQTLSKDERAAVVATAVAASPEGATVMPGIAAYGAREACAWAEQAADAGAQAVMLLPPNAYRAGESTVVEHYAEVAKVGLPVVAYNNPIDTKVDLTPAMLARLHGEGLIVAVKEFTGDVRRAYEIAELAPGLDILVGSDDVALEVALAGAVGWVSGYPNALPQSCMALWRACVAQDLDAALPLYRELHPLLRWDSKTEFVQAIKLSMDLAGRAGGPCRPPARPPDARAGRRRAHRHRGGARLWLALMRSSRVLHTVESHTEGMPTRVVVGGVGPMPGATMFDRRRWFLENSDDLRTMLMYEPRGHSAMSGAILQPPTRPDADWGVLYIEVSGCLPMCGHGTIGVATVLVETGMVEVVEPETTIRLDTPAGLVVARVAVADGRATSVTITNVASYVHELDAKVELPGLGQVGYDMAYGGNFYAIVDLDRFGLPYDRAEKNAILQAGLDLMAAINEQNRPVHPENPEIAVCHHVQLVAPGSTAQYSRHAMAIHPGWFDRSPCGTGTSARVAQLARTRRARARRGLRQRVVHRQPVHRAGHRGDDGRWPPGRRPDDHGASLGDRHGAVAARSRTTPSRRASWSDRRRLTCACDDPPGRVGSVTRPAARRSKRPSRWETSPSPGSTPRGVATEDGRMTSVRPRLLAAVPLLAVAFVLAPTAAPASLPDSCNGGVDVAVGTPKADVSGQADAGSVTIVFEPDGASPSLGNAADLVVTEAMLGGTAAAGDRFGAAVVTGYEDATPGCSMVAVGAPGADGGKGKVYVFVLDQDGIVPGSIDVISPGHRRCGRHRRGRRRLRLLALLRRRPVRQLARGRLAGRGHRLRGRRRHGPRPAVHGRRVLVGGRLGVLPAGSQPRAGRLGDRRPLRCRPRCRVATSGRLWVGSPDEDLGTHKDAGSVVSLPGSYDSTSGTVKLPGTLGSAAVVVTQDYAGVPGAVEADDRFGAVLAGLAGTQSTDRAAGDRRAGRGHRDDQGRRVDHGRLPGPHVGRLPAGCQWLQRRRRVRATASAPALSVFGTALLVGAPGEDVGSRRGRRHGPLHQLRGRRAEAVGREPAGLPPGLVRRGRHGGSRGPVRCLGRLRRRRGRDRRAR